jgi:competence CoiA-like predicted nuclease
VYTALDPRANVVEAGDAQRRSEHLCPGCHDVVILKRGPKRTPHFAHYPFADCFLAFESYDHLRAKVMLLKRFRSLGLQAWVEVPLRPDRRVDLAVVLESGRRLAIEVQASAISVDEMKARIADHRRHGYAATGWVFTRNRYPKLYLKALGDEVRLPGEMAYLLFRYRALLYTLDVAAERLTGFQFQRIFRPGEEYHIPDGGGEMAVGSGRRLTRTFNLQARIPTGFAPSISWTRLSPASRRPEPYMEFGAVRDLEVPF